MANTRSKKQASLAEENKELNEHIKQLKKDISFLNKIVKEQKEEIAELASFKILLEDHVIAQQTEIQHTDEEYQTQLEKVQADQTQILKLLKDMSERSRSVT